MSLSTRHNHADASPHAISLSGFCELASLGLSCAFCFSVSFFSFFSFFLCLASRSSSSQGVAPPTAPPATPPAAALASALAARSASFLARFAAAASSSAPAPAAGLAALAPLLEGRSEEALSRFRPDCRPARARARSALSTRLRGKGLSG